jgi:hypothetical protein
MTEVLYERSGLAIIWSIYCRDWIASAADRWLMVIAEPEAGAFRLMKHWASLPLN